MKFTFVLDEQMVQQMVELIASGPYRLAAPILNELQKQANEQRQGAGAVTDAPANRHDRRASVSNSGPKGNDAKVAING